MLTLFSVKLTWYDLWWTLAVGYIILILCVIGIVVSENRNPLKSLAWITVLVLFPVGGVVLYFIFGRSIKNVRMISRKNRRRLLAKEGPITLPKQTDDLTTADRQCIRLAHSLGNAMFYTGNSILLYDNGAAFFEQIFTELSAAKSFINIQFYIIANDDLGRRLRDILIERARAGVKVRVIYDYIGSFDASRRDFFQRMKAHGIEVHSFFRLDLPRHLSRVNWRNHRKVVIIDGKVGFIGGLNVADRYVNGFRGGAWRDTGARVSGSVVASLQYNFAVDWKFMGQPLLTDELSQDVSHIDGEIFPVSMQVLSSGPNDRWGNMALLFYKAISTARKRVYLQTPYFMPSEGLMKALESAALAGVDVRVMIPLDSDSRLLTYASHSYIEECLLAGIKVYLYEKGMLHSKVLIVDDSFSTMGSTNFDFRSLEHNFEENLLIYSSQANETLLDMFNEDISHSRKLKLSEWNKRSRLDKANESLSRLLSPIL